MDLGGRGAWLPGWSVVFGPQGKSPFLNLALPPLQQLERSLVQLDGNKRKGKKAGLHFRMARMPEPYLSRMEAGVHDAMGPKAPQGNITNMAYRRLSPQPYAPLSGAT